MVTPQSPEFIPQLSTSPNFYAPYHQQTTTVTSTVNGKTISPNTLLKQTASTQQPQQQQQQQQQQHLNGMKTSVNGLTSTSNMNIAPAAPITPLKTNGRSSLLSNENSPTNQLDPQQSQQQQQPQQQPQQPHDKTPPRMTPHNSPIPTAIPPGVHQENVGGTIYFYMTANHTSGQTSCSVVNSETVLNHHSSVNVVSGAVVTNNSTPTSMLYGGVGGHHVYPGPASNVISMQPKSQLSSAFFMPDDMRMEIQARNEIANLMLEAHDNTNPTNPAVMEVGNYHSLYPLEPQTIHPKLPCPSSTYKATNSTTGIKYCLRRLHAFRLPSLKCMTLVDKWKQLQHSNVVQLREVFTTKAFGDNSLILIYDYHPGSQTLFSKYFTPSQDSNGYTDPFGGEARPFSHKSNLQRTVNGPLLPESTIWAIIMQLTAGLRAIHQAGLACRQLDPTKIIVTGKRIRFSFLGISDLVSFDPNHANQLAVLHMHQQEDLTQLGKLVLALACRCLQSVQRDNFQTSIELVSRQYSSDLRNFILFLFNSAQRRSVTDLMPMIGARFYTQLDALQSQCDMQEDELAKETENGRLYRILIKLGCINERPDFNLDVTWSETGDRYMLKLFRDYLFHSVTEDGRPWLDHAHIVQCLNKLDAGTMEKVQLMSRDEQSILIVTYAELKNCLENAFSELVAQAPS
ncbi:PAN3 family protein [Megaselia abdita]